MQTLNLITVWDKNKPNAQSCIYIVKSADEIDFFKFIKINAIFPRKIYVISPDLYPILDICIAYAAEKNGYLSLWERLPSRPAFLIRRINHALKSWQIKTACDVIKELREEIKEKNLDIKKFLDEKISLLEDFVYPFLWEAPFSLPNVVNTHKKWWLSTADNTVKFNNFIVNWEREFDGNGNAHSNLLNHMKMHASILRKFSGINKSDRINAINEASAYCMFQANLRFYEANYSLAILLCHRSADLLLMSLCDDFDLINFTPSAPKFKISYNGKNEIHLMTSYAALSANGMAADPQRENCFNKLNSIRNHLIYTHYFGSISTTDASSVFNDIKGYLSTLGGSNWNSSVTQYEKKFEFSASVILESKKSIITGIQERSV